MPMYVWVDEETSYEVEVLRSFDDYKVPPEDNDLPEEERGKERKWKKLIKGTVSGYMERRWLAAL